MDGAAASNCLFRSSANLPVARQDREAVRAGCSLWVLFSLKVIQIQSEQVNSLYQLGHEYSWQIQVDSKLYNHEYSWPSCIIMISSYIIYNIL
jgi:hypothetical protein